MDIYGDFDAKIIKAIDDGYNTFSRLIGHKLTTNSRVLDRRLRALRKAGAIEYVDRYWRVCRSRQAPKMPLERTT